MTKISKNTVIAKNQSEAVRLILAELEHDFSGTLAAQLDAAQIERTEDSANYRDIYTHPDINNSVAVEW